MRVKKFLAKSLPDAVTQVKSELGVDAVILHIQEVKVGGVFGFFGTRMMQVVAAADEAPLPKAQATGAAAPAAASVLAPAPALVSAPALVTATAPSPVLPTAPAPAPSLAPAPILAAAASLAHARPANGAGELGALKADMADVKAMLGQIRDRVTLAAQVAGLEPELDALRARLLAGGVDDSLALDLLTRVREELQQAQLPWSEAPAIAERMICSDLGAAQTIGLGGRVVALVGPTGVGKTTTVAKLAAYYALQKRVRVSLIAADTYRVAAVDQLRTYSEILGVPLEVVYDPAEMAAAVNRHRHRDLILVDTAGRSPRNRAHMQELTTYMEALRPDETYLVMSLTSSYRDALKIVEHYEPIGFDRFLFTKRDEVEAPGLIYNIRRAHGRPLSYVTTGQSVPDDIEVADPSTITRAILGD